MDPRGGLCDEATRDKDWLDYANQLMDGREPVEEYERLKGIVGEFCLNKTKAELLERACTRRLLIAPVATPSDVVSSAQFEARDFFDQVDDDALARAGRSPRPDRGCGRRRSPRSASAGRPVSASTPNRVRAAALGRARRRCANARCTVGDDPRSKGSRCST